VIPVLVAAVASLVAPLPLRPLLRRLNVVDVPGRRSSHTVVVLRGAGLGVLLAVVLGLALAFLAGSVISGIVALAVLAAGSIGWIEDVQGIPIPVRAAGQLVVAVAAAVTIAVALGAAWWIVIPGVVAIATYINVANFMDGVDGMSSLHGAVAGATFAAAGLIYEEPWLMVAGAVVSVAFLAFLPWNILGGRMFLGDAGSYTLGASIAIIGFAAICAGVNPVCVVAPCIVYLADAGSTLVIRIARRQRWFESHRDHAYQRLIDLGHSHLGVSLTVAVASAISGGVALLGAHATMAGQILIWAAVVLIGGAFVAYGRMAKRPAGRMGGAE
jgi:UDP-N-acetylmuramyl pentapeptide phosphotransferase/UDP-N-acetylglucosamine-1-phosphate transferase